MNIKKIVIPFSFLTLLTSCYAQKKTGDEKNENVTCVVQTELGDITIEVYPKMAPITVTNFLTYVDAGLYDNSAFTRTVTLENQPENPIKIEVVQVGEASLSQQLDPIIHETTKQTGVLHKSGTISMARIAPGSATSSFFICINDQPELDFGGKRNADGQGYAAFGKVIKGMDVVKKIQQAPSSGQTLIPPVAVNKIRRVK